MATTLSPAALESSTALSTICLIDCFSPHWATSEAGMSLASERTTFFAALS